MTERIKLLKKKLLDGTHKEYREESLDVSILDSATQKLPFPVRKAMAFDKALEMMPIFIQQGELIVGGKTVYSLPEYITEHEKEIGNHNFETRGYENIFDLVFNLGQDERGYGIPNSSNPAYYRILEQGIPGIIAEAEKKLEETDDESKKVFYNSVIISYKAVIKLLKRFELLALEQMREATDEAAKRDLCRISENCRALQTRPPVDFWEAVQLVYFIQFLIWVEGGYLVPLGRIDQYLYKYYKKDTEEGRLTREAALELLECMFIKLNYEIDRTHGEAGKFESDTGQTITVGGVLADSGEDSTNELTYLCLDAVGDLRITDPKVHLRLSTKSPDELWRKAVELTALGMGFPTYDNDDAIIPALMNTGNYYKEEDARDYCGSGCWEIIIQGRSFNRNLGMIDCLRALEWALNNGDNILPVKRDSRGMINGKWGVETGDVESFETFEELFNAFKVQLKHNIDTVSTNCNKARLTYSPFYSSVIEDCMEKGKDICQGGCRYNETDFQMSALSNCADALYAIKKLVYDDKRLTLKEFTDILKNNYEGNELFRQEILNRLPKFGNNIEEVDMIAKEIAVYYTREVKKHINSLGGPYRARISSALGYVALAEKLGASADGRKASEFYASNLSPQLGADRNGPTSVIQSVTKIDFSNCAGGAVLDLKFNPALLKTDENKEKLINLLKTYFKLGGLQVQINVVDSGTLKDAKKNPEKYKELIVRVWGFSTYFVSLPEKYQDHIIARTEYGL